MNSINPLETPHDPSYINPLTSRSYSSTSWNDAFIQSESPSLRSSSLSLQSGNYSGFNRNLNELKSEIEKLKEIISQLRKENDALRKENDVLKKEKEKDALHRRSLLASLENQNARNSLLVLETQRLAHQYSPPRPLNSHQHDNSSDCKHKQFALIIFIIFYLVVS